MAQNDEYFPPDTVDEQIEQLSHSTSDGQPSTLPEAQLVMELRHIYHPHLSTEDRASLQRVKQHIAYKRTDVVRPQRGSVYNRGLSSPGTGYGKNSSSPVRRQSGFVRGFSILAAVLVVGLLVGSWALVTHMAGGLKEGPRGQENIYIGSNQIVYKLNARDGSVIWKQSLARSAPQDPANNHFGVHVLNGVVYAFMDRDIYALSASDGNEIWHQFIATPDSLKNEDLSIIDEVVDNGIIYLEHGNGGISARSTKDGTVKWSNYTFHVGGSQVSGSSFAVFNGAVYADTYSEKQRSYTLFAFDGETGRERWHFAKKGLPSGPVTVTDGVVYDAGNPFYALNERTGQQIWQYTLPHDNQFFISPRVINGVLYASTFAEFGQTARTIPKDPTNYFRVYAFDAKTGNILWISLPGYSLHYDSDTDELPISSEGVIASQSPYTLITVIPVLYVLDPLNDKLLWQVSATNICTSTINCHIAQIELINGTLYIIVSGSKQTLQAFDVRTGKKLSEHPLSFTFGAYDSSSVNNGIAYILGNTSPPKGGVGSMERAIDAIRLADGSRVWHFRIGDQKDYANGNGYMVSLPVLAP